MIKKQEARPASLTVPLATPNFRKTTEVPEIHPALQGFAIAGLSAVVAVSRNRFPFVSPLLTRENQYGELTIINPEFLGALEIEGEEQQIAIAGIQLVGIAVAASDLLNNPKAKIEERLLSTRDAQFTTDIPVQSKEDQQYLGHKYDAGVHRGSMLSRMELQAKYTKFSDYNSVASWLDLAFTVEPNKTEFASLSAVTYHNTVSVNLTSGSTTGRIINVHHHQNHFKPLERFTLAMIAAENQLPSIS